MKPFFAQAEDFASGWRETLSLAMDLGGLPGLFNVEWLIDSAECDELGGLWW